MPITDQIIPKILSKFNFEDATRQVLLKKGFLPNELQSLSALKFLETAEFQKQLGILHKEFNVTSPTADIDSPTSSDKLPSENLFKIKDMQNADFDISKFTKADILKVFNDNAQQIRQKYEQNLKTTTAQFQKDHIASQKLQQDYEQLSSVVQNLPAFLGKKYGNDQVSPQLVSEIQEFAIATAATRAGKTVSQYYQDLQTEITNKQANQQKLVSNVDQAVGKFVEEDVLFKAIKLDDKVDTLKNALVKQQFEPTMSIEPIARALFMEEYDELIKQQAIAEVLEKKDQPALDAISTTPNVVAEQTLDPEMQTFDQEWALAKAKEQEDM